MGGGAPAFAREHERTRRRAVRRGSREVRAGRRCVVRRLLLEICGRESALFNEAFARAQQLTGAPLAGYSRRADLARTPAFGSGGGKRAGGGGCPEAGELAVRVVVCVSLQVGDWRTREDGSARLQHPLRERALAPCCLTDLRDVCLCLLRHGVDLLDLDTHARQLIDLSQSREQLDISGPVYHRAPKPVRDSTGALR